MYRYSQAVFYLASDDERARRAAEEFFAPRGLKLVWMEGVTFGKDGDRTSVVVLQNAVAGRCTSNFVDP